MASVWIGVAASAAYANPICADLFRDHTETDRKAAEIRARLFNSVYRVSTEALSGRNQFTKEYRNFIEMRRKVSSASIEKALNSSPTLKKLEMHVDTKDINGGSMLPPELSREAQQAMISETIATPLLAKILSEDPYFIWLKHNALSGKNADPETLRFRGATIRTEKEQKDPVAAYLNARTDGYRGEVALMVVQRAMDPLISADILRVIDRVVYNDEILRTIEKKIMPWLESGKQNHGYDNADVESAWRRFPSLGAARENLRVLFDTQAEMYGHLFSRSAYERVLYLAAGEKHADPILSVIREYSDLRLRGLDDAMIGRSLAGRLEELRVRVGASKELSTSEFYQVVDRILTLVAGEKMVYKKLTYEYVLADVFSERHEESRIVTGRGAQTATSREIQALRKLIELHENLATHKTTVDYLLKLNDRN